MACKRSRGNASGAAEARVERALAQIVFRGSDTQQDADDVMACQGAALSRKASSRYWCTGRAEQSELAKLIVAKLGVCTHALERHMAQVEGVADGVARRLDDGELDGKDAIALVQRYTELMKCWCEMAKQTAERKRSVAEVGEAEDTTLAAILGDDMDYGRSRGNALHDATRQAAAATATLFEAVGEA